MKLKKKKKTEKEPAAEPEQEQKPAAGKKPKIEKKIYIIVCAALVFLLAAVVALILIITTGGKKDSKAPERDAVSDAEEPPSSPEPEPPPEESEGEPEPENKTEPPKEPEIEPEPEAKLELEPEPEPAPAPEPEPKGDGGLEEDLHISLSEAVNFVEGLSPSLLNLPGESMDQYEILTNQYIIPVDGLLCSEVMVYNRDDITGTNQLMATLLVSRGPDGRLFRMERESGSVVEVDLTGGQ